jgi:hypothetical protein
MTPFFRFTNERSIRWQNLISTWYLRELSSTKTGSYPHEFLCRTDCSACADYQPCKVCWNKCSVARLRVYIFFIDSFKDTCKNKLGWGECYAVANALTIRNMYSLLLYMKCNSRKINRPTKNINIIISFVYDCKVPTIFVMFFVGRLILRELHFIYNNKLYMFLIVKAFATA